MVSGAEELSIQTARLEERVENLEEYRARQNGSIQRLEAKFDRLQSWLVGLLGAALVNAILMAVELASKGRGA